MIKNIPIAASSHGLSFKRSKEIFVRIDTDRHNWAAIVDLTAADSFA